MKSLSIIFLIFFSILFNESLAEKEKIDGVKTVTPKKKISKKMGTGSLIDVQDLLADMIKKEEEIIKVQKSRSNYKLATTILGSTLGLLAAVVVSGVTLVLYNAEHGRHPFQIGSSSDNNSGSDDASSNGSSNNGN